MKEQSIRRKTAELAMLQDRDNNFDSDIHGLVSLADKLSGIKAENEGKCSDCKNFQSLREDSAKICMDKQTLLSLAPEVKDGYIFVPSVMEGE